MAGQGKTVLITGAAKRIGRAIATAFADNGWSVILHCNRSLAEAEELCHSLPGGGHVVVQGDFSTAESINAFLESLEGSRLHFDCLVNSASCYLRKPLVATTLQEMTAIYNVNFFAPFQLMRFFAEKMKSGSIINITDQRTASVDPAAGIYALAKKSLRDATEAAALDWAPSIRVNAVAPGLVLSPPGVPPEKIKPLLKKVPMRTRITEQEIAQACLFLAHAETITGQTLYLDGGMHLQGFPLESGVTTAPSPSKKQANSTKPY